jgi:predicted DNA-binding transcriptional regulator AlpA
MVDREFLSPAEVSTWLNVSIDVIDDLEWRGMLPEMVDIGGRFAFSRRAIERWLQNNCQPADPERFAWIEAATGDADNEAELREAFAEQDRRLSEIRSKLAKRGVQR